MRSTTTRVPPEYHDQTAGIMKARMVYGTLAFAVVMGAAAWPELSAHPDRSGAFAVFYAVEMAVWLAGTLMVYRWPRTGVPPVAVAIVTSVLIVIIIAAYHVCLDGEAEVVELAIAYMVVSSMVLFPWGGRGQSVVAIAGFATYLTVLACGLAPAPPVGIHVLGLGTAAVLSVAGAIFLERYRFRIFCQTAELQRVNDAKTQLLANVSHELRTPLSVVIGYQQLLQEGAFGELPPGAVDPLNRVVAYSRMLLNLIDDFLDLSRLEANRLDLRMETVELRGLCTEVSSLIEPLLRDKPVEFRCVVDNGEVVHADRDRLRQVLVNLLTNAVKFTDQGRIELSCHRVESRVAIEVADTGVGIAVAEQEAIFEPFRRGTHSERVRGVGIGLALSRHLTEAMGGRMIVTSAPGRGSIFSVQLDANTASAAGGASLLA